MGYFALFLTVLYISFVDVNAIACPRAVRHGRHPPPTCTVKDPNNLPKTGLQKWFSKADFEDFFPKANQGWGPHKCLPYSYEAFIIASRYFPEFGTASVVGATAGKTTFTKKQLQRRDVAAFFAHILQETGETDYELFNSTLAPTEARECFYRGGLYHFYEGGPRSPFFPSTLESDTLQPEDGKSCFLDGRYCNEAVETSSWYPCENGTDSAEVNEDDSTEGSGTEQKIYKSCYFGRGPLQLSWNYNYGQFQHFLAVHNIKVDLLANPDLLITKLDPPLAMLSALWFYMTPQPPKPAMHDVIMGNWRPSQKNIRAGYEGSVFGPTSLIINKECHGEDADEPGTPGENRRVKAFRWFSEKLNVPIENERLLSCKGMLEPFDAMPHKYSWQPDWSTMWKSQPCDCAPASYPGALPYYDPKFYPERMVKENDRNRLRCVYGLYKNKEMFRITPDNSPCIKHQVKIRLNKDGI
uniref:Glyco_hydro_19_cat domain-containing protein n=1 Tax=Panagrellus redivivus TaxID=6233 RepID=A0A7E4VTR4_PANRE